MAGAIREREYRREKFAASLKGIDLDAEMSKAGILGQEERSLDMIKKRAAARIAGATAEDLEKLELQELGLAPKAIVEIEQKE